MHPPALKALLLAAFVVVATFDLASASLPGGFSEANVVWYGILHLYEETWN